LRRERGFSPGGGLLGSRLVRESFGLKDCLGLSFISYLLRHPGTEFHVLDLGERAPDRALARDPAKQLSASLPMNPEELEASGIHVGGLGDAGELLDEQAKAAYKARLRELREELEEAREFGNVERAARVEEEIDALGAELSRAIRPWRTPQAGRFGHGTSAAAGQKKNIQTAIRRITKHDPELGRMFSRCVRTGIYCSYIQDPKFQLEWQFAATTPTSAASPIESGGVQKLLQVQVCVQRRCRSTLMLAKGLVLLLKRNRGMNGWWEERAR